MPEKRVRRIVLKLRGLRPRIVRRFVGQEPNVPWKRRAPMGRSKRPNSHHHAHKTYTLNIQDTCHGSCQGVPARRRMRSSVHVWFHLISCRLSLVGPLEGRGDKSGGALSACIARRARVRPSTRTGGRFCGDLTKISPTIISEEKKVLIRLHNILPEGWKYCLFVWNPS